MNRQQQQQQLVLPEPNQVATTVVRGIGRFAKRNKVLTGGYLFGWLFLLLVGNGARMTVQQVRDYNRIMDSVDLQVEYDASQKYYHALNAYRVTKGWFWSCDAVCSRNKDRMIRAERELNAIREEGAARMSDAKRVAGLFSEVAVGEVKDSFWQYFSQGKQFAKRQSMWDAMFMGIRTVARGRDESMFEYGLKVLMQVLINFSMGLCMALLFFVMGLWNIVRSYQPNPIVAVVFFLGAACAGGSFVVTYLAAMFGAAGAGVYGVLKVAETSARANRINNGQQRQRVQYQQQRPHYD